MNFRNYFLYIISTIFLSIGSVQISAQHKIEIQIDNYEQDTVVIGYYVLDKQLVHDTLVAVKRGKFILEDTLQSGVYLLLTWPDNEYLQFIVNDSEPSFKMRFDIKDKLKVKFKGSKDNEVFQDYVEFINDKRPKAEKLKDTINALKKLEKDATKFEKELSIIDNDVKAKQDLIITKYPNLISTLLLKSNLEIDMPEFDNSDNGRIAQYRYYKAHYFDHIELDNPKSLRTPFLFKRVDYYINKLTPNHPDSVIQSIDSVLHWMQPAEEIYRYYLSNFLNTYIQAKIIGYDAIFVHIVDEYYAKGKAPWVDEENLLKILDIAQKAKPLLIGKIAEDIMVYGEDGTPISISEIDYEYLILLFWAPDCGHCKKSMPGFVEFNEKNKDKGIKTFAICTKFNDKVKDCWEMVKEKDMLGFINGADEFHKSRFKILYNVDTTPQVFILDKNRKIVMKRVGADQLDQVFEEIYRIKELERLEKK